MKILVLMCILMTLGCNPKSKSKSVIQSFIKKVEEGSTIISLSENGLVRKPEGGYSKEYSATHDMILKSLQEKLIACQLEKGEYEILSLQEGLMTKEYAEDLFLADQEGEVYILLCSNELLTYFLIEDDQIASYSTLNKGGERFFFMN